MTRARRQPFLCSIAAIAALAVFPACGPEAAGEGKGEIEDGRAVAPGVDALANATYRGVYDEPMTLEDGRWEGEAVEPGAASRPSVELVDDFRMTGVFGAADGGGIFGRSGCNRYNAGVAAGDMPGSMKVSPVVGTRMACPEDVMALERRYLSALEGEVGTGFLSGKLALTTTRDDVTTIMLFERRAPAAK